MGQWTTILSPTARAVARIVQRASLERRNGARKSNPNVITIKVKWSVPKQLIYVQPGLITDFKTLVKLNPLATIDHQKQGYGYLARWRTHA